MPQPDFQEPILPNGMDLPAQTLDEGLLSGNHEWSLLPASGLGFRETVEQATNPRVDMQRYKNIAGNNRTIARNLSSLLCRSNTLFRVPDSLQCSRTFARDNEEAYYLDAMDVYLSAPPGELKVEDVPLLKRPLSNRMFCAFGRKPGYRGELFERRRVKVWQPFDAPEDRDANGSELCSTYPKVEAFFNDIYQPPALAIPIPPAFFYYHKELRDAQILPYMQGSWIIVRLQFCARKEYCILFLAMWWNEVYYGGRMYVLVHSTINKLEYECGEVYEIAGMPAQAIIAHMRIVADTPSQHHNWMCFDDSCMESSTFVWGIKYTWGLDTSKPVRKRYFCSRLQRKISTCKYGGPIDLGSSVMEGCGV